MKDFTCLRCRSTYRTQRRHVLGLPIEDWWAGQQYTCKACHAAAAEQQPDAEGLEAQFEQFHAANPHVYEALRREGSILLARGHRKLGMKMLYERLRWQVYMETVDDEYDFKLPNNYTAYYARKLMAQEKDFAGVFNVAELRSRRPVAA